MAPKSSNSWNHMSEVFKGSQALSGDGEEQMGELKVGKNSAYCFDKKKFS